MKIINPSEISGKIINLFDEAEKFVTIVSPYYNFSNWKKLNKRLTDAKNKGVRIQFYVRKDEWKSISEVKNIGYNPIEITNLHAKVYFNETQAIVTSMNLNESSDSSSLDIGLQTETTKEYEEVINFYKKFIRGRNTANNNSHEAYQSTHQNNWIDEIVIKLAEIFGCRPSIRFEDFNLNIHGRNKYNAFIANERTNILRIKGILSIAEYNYLISNPDIFKTVKMKIETQKGNQSYFDLIWATIGDFKSWNLKEVFPSEERLVIDSIVDFIKGVEQMKEMVNKK